MYFTQIYILLLYTGCVVRTYTLHGIDPRWRYVVLAAIDHIRLRQQILLYRLRGIILPGTLKCHSRPMRFPRSAAAAVTNGGGIFAVGAPFKFGQ